MDSTQYVLIWQYITEAKKHLHVYSSIIKHGRQKAHDYFLLLFCKSSIWFTNLQRFFFQNYHIFFWYIKMCHKLCHFIWGIWWSHRSKNFEAMKARSANITRIRSWNFCLQCHKVKTKKLLCLKGVCTSRNLNTWTWIL